MGERRIAGRYELVEQLGTSGWRAVDTDLKREVFVRMPGRDVSAARLTHHGIVPLFDQGEEDGVPYAVYEYLGGGSLEQRLAAAPLSQAEAGRVAADVTAALAYAHAQDVTHGSIGPASVMLSVDGDAKLAGFAGAGTQADDDRALAALLEMLGATATATAASDAAATAILAPEPKLDRRPFVLAALAALALLGAGVGAALLATSGESTPDGATTGSTAVATSTGSTQEPVVPPPATTSDTTNETTPTAPPSPTTAPVTTEPAPPKEPSLTEPPTTDPVPTTEPPPPETTEPPPTTEPPQPPTTAAITETTD